MILLAWILTHQFKSCFCLIILQKWNPRYVLPSISHQLWWYTVILKVARLTGWQWMTVSKIIRLSASPCLFLRLYLKHTNRGKTNSNSMKYSAGRSLLQMRAQDAKVVEIPLSRCCFWSSFGTWNMKSEKKDVQFPIWTQHMNSWRGRCLHVNKVV